MRRTLRPAFAALAVLAFSMLSTTAAQAAEGPFYKIAKSRLLSGESEQVRIGTVGHITIVSPPTGIRYECSNVKTPSAKLLGSTGANSATNEEQFEWSSCVLAGNGTPCVGPFPELSQPLQGKLVYSDSERTGVIDMDILPASGTKFIILAFSGSGCRLTELTVRGSVAGELWSGGKAVKVGEEPAETSKLEVRFPSSPIKNVWSEITGALVEATPHVESFGEEDKIEGALSFTLTGEANWGVYTK